MTITNLTGCTWVANNVVEIENVTYYVDFTSNSNNYNALSLENIVPPEAPNLGKGLHYYAAISGTPTMAYDGDADAWVNSAYKTVIFTGGADIEDLALIAWLEVNGTLTPPYPPTRAGLDTLLTDIADEVRAKTGSEDPIRVTDLPTKISTILIAIELTQQAYDELESYDPNTYYIIVEE